MIAANRKLAPEADERNTARFSLRTRPHVKQIVQKAAALSGLDDTAFIMKAAYDAAMATIERHERTILSGPDAAAFFAALDNPPPPTERLKEAIKRHRERVVSDMSDF